MSKIYREDGSTCKFDAVDANGFLRGFATLAKEGVYEYGDATGKTWRELTPLSTLTDTKWLKSLKMSPITLDHPAAGMVNRKNFKSLSVGTGGSEFATDGSGISSELTIMDDAAIAAAQSTHQEISLGYYAQVEDRAGVWNGQAYDRVQVARTANHIALVPAGRHGPDVRSYFDAATVARQDGAAIQVGKLTDETAKITRSKVDPELKQALKDAADAAALATTEKARADAAEGKVLALTAEVTALKADVAALPAKIDAAKADAAAAAKARATLDAKAVEMLGKDFVCDGKTDSEVKRAMLDSKGIKVDAATDERVLDGALLAVAASVTGGSTALDALAAGLALRGDNRATVDADVAKAIQAQADFNARFK